MKKLLLFLWNVLVAIVHAVKPDAETVKARQTNQIMERYRMELKAWQDKERKLKEQNDKAEEAYFAYMAGHSNANGVNTLPGQLERLHDAWGRASKALGDWRKRQPKNPVT